MLPEHVEPPIRRVARVLLTLSFLTTAWNAVSVGGLQPSDVLMLLAVLALILLRIRVPRPLRIPPGMLIGASLIGAAGLLSAIFPPSPLYVADRYAPPDFTSGALVARANLPQLGKFEIALLVIPMAVALFHPSIRELKRFANAWAISALCSASIAITDALGITNVNRGILGYIDTSGRQAGLSAQENHLAMALVLVAPVVISWVAHPAIRVRVLGLVGVVITFFGMLESGSRAGFVVLLLCVALASALTPKLRRMVPIALLAAPLVLVALLADSGSLLTTIATESRLASGLGAQSDIGRSLLQQQALLDIQSSPFFGIGFDHLTDAHEVHLQLLAAGGVLTLAGYAFYWLTVARIGIWARKFETHLAPLLLSSVLSFVVLNFFENQVSDRYLYVPCALLVGIRLCLGARADAARKSALEPPSVVPKRRREVSI